MRQGIFLKKQAFPDMPLKQLFLIKKNTYFSQNLWALHIEEFVMIKNEFTEEKVNSITSLCRQTCTNCKKNRDVSRARRLPVLQIILIRNNLLE